MYCDNAWTGSTWQQTLVYFLFGACWSTGLDGVGPFMISGYYWGNGGETIGACIVIFVTVFVLVFAILSSVVR